MRRLLILLMLTLLPLQAGWAAVCAYCPDDCIPETAASALAQASDEAVIPDAEDNCSRCQLGGIGIASAPATASIVPHFNNFALWGAAFKPDSGPPERPERPNWTRAA